MPNLRGRFLPALVMFVAGLLGGASFLAARTVHAQSQNLIQFASGTISVANPAVIITATSGRSIVIVGAKLCTAATAGVLTFLNGTSPGFTNGSGLAAYMPASTNTDLSAANNPALSSGVIATTAGNALEAQCPGAILTYEISYYLQ